jgi:hypothetical protein
LAQLYKECTSEIKGVGRVKTSVSCRADLLKKNERTIHVTKDLQQEYKEFRAKRQISEIIFS